MDSRNNLRGALLRGGSWAAAGQGWHALSSLLTNAILARLLAPEDYGSYFLLVSVVNGGVILGTLGLGQTVVRLIAESIGHGKPGGAYQAVIRVFLAAGVGSGIITCLTGLWALHWLAHDVFDAPSMHGTAWVTAFWLFFLSAQTLVAESFRGLQDIRSAAVYGGMLSTGILVALLGSLWIGPGQAELGQVVGLSAFCCAASSVVGGAMLLRRIRPLRRTNNVAAASISHVAWPLWVNGISHYVLTQASMWVVGIWLVEDEVALFGAAQRLVAVIGLPLMIVNAFVAPMIAEQYARGDRSSLQRTLQALTSLAALPSILVFILFAIAGKPLLALIYGEFYTGAWLCLLLLSLSQVLNVMAGSCGLTLAMLGHQRALMVVTICNGVATLVALIAIVGSFRIQGVAAVVALSMAGQRCTLAWIAWRRTGLRTWGSLASLRDGIGILRDRSI